MAMNYIEFSVNILNFAIYVYDIQIDIKFVFFPFGWFFRLGKNARHDVDLGHKHIFADISYKNKND